MRKWQRLILIEKLKEMAWLSVLTVLLSVLFFMMTNPEIVNAKMLLGNNHDEVSTENTSTWHHSKPLNITLDEAIKVALANNPEVAAITYEVNASVEQRNIAISEQFPNVHVISSYNHQLNSQRLIPSQGNGYPCIYTRDIFAGDYSITYPHVYWLENHLSNQGC